MNTIWELFGKCMETVEKNTSLVGFGYKFYFFNKIFSRM